LKRKIKILYNNYKGINSNTNSPLIFKKKTFESENENPLKGNTMTNYNLEMNINKYDEFVKMIHENSRMLRKTDIIVFKFL